MLAPLRKFSQSIYAKILLGIIVIPFVFWGMGSTLTGGNKNIIVKIDNDKYSIQEFTSFVQRYVDPNQPVNQNQIENLLLNFIGDKLIEKEIEFFEIKLSDKSLSNLIKKQKEFQRNNKFSRTEYEKFLLKNGTSAVFFEKNILRQEQKNQLLSFIGSGIYTSNFLVNNSFNKINQKRSLQLINLKEAFSDKLSFSDDRIKEYFIENTNKYSENYITFNMIELTPKSLVGIEEFNNQYFKKLDEIDEMIVGGENASTIINKFNLRKPILVMMNKDGKDINFNKVENITDTILNTVFKLDEIENISLLETDNKYFIIEFVKKEIIQQKLEDKEVKKLVLSDLKKQTKRKFISEIISKINQNNFSKLDFDKFAKNQSLNIEKINLISINDNKILKNEIVEQVYSFAEKKVVLIHDTTFSENYLVYINDIRNDNIDKNSADYEKYNKLSKNKIRNELYNTYDNYIKSKYKIDINYKVLKSVQNYFN